MDIIISMTKHDQFPCKGIFRDPVHWLAFGFGSGCSPLAPGTAGTIAAIPVFLLLKDTSLWIYLVVTLAMFVVGVWDEIVGYLITMIAAPEGWLWILTGFFLFRLFDILKPWPISLADRRINNGFGIMFDDVLAGGLALISIQLIDYYKIL